MELTQTHIDWGNKLGPVAMCPVCKRVYEEPEFVYLMVHNEKSGFFCRDCEFQTRIDDCVDNMLVVLKRRGAPRYVLDNVEDGRQTKQLEGIDDGWLMTLDEAKVLFIEYHPMLDNVQADTIDVWVNLFITRLHEDDLICDEDANFWPAQIVRMFTNGYTIGT
jgi:uncharacterized protein YbaR (Trm112 family)